VINILFFYRFFIQCNPVVQFSLIGLIRTIRCKAFNFLKFLILFPFLIFNQFYYINILYFPSNCQAKSQQNQGVLKKKNPPKGGF